MADLKTTAEERARLHRSAQFNIWLPGSATLTMQALDDLDTLLAENEGLSGVVRALSGAEAACIAERSRILRENAKLRAVAEAEVERLRGLVRWFLDGDDCAHEDDCGARGNHDLDVCRNTKPCADETCDGPHCTCEATMMRDRARAALGEP